MAAVTLTNVNRLLLICVVCLTASVAESTGVSIGSVIPEDWKNSSIDYRLTQIDYNASDSQVLGQSGNTVFLRCTVRNMADQMVSWVRQRDWHILTSGLHIYTADERFQILRESLDLTRDLTRDIERDAAQEAYAANTTWQWVLQIQYVQLNDAGTYICQVPTDQGLLSHEVRLEVLVPEVFILGQKDLIVDTGTTLSLVCIIQNSLVAPDFVFWYHNERLLNFDPSRPGVSVETEHDGRTHSQLKIANALEKDSGNYTCRASHGQPASIHVQVWTGDQAAAMSRKNGACASTSALTITLVSLLVMYLNRRLHVTLR